MDIFSEGARWRAGLELLIAGLAIADPCISVLQIKNHRASLCSFAFHSASENQMAEGNGINSLSSYLRAIKTIYNKGVKVGLIEREGPAL